MYFRAPNAPILDDISRLVAIQSVEKCKDVNIASKMHFLPLPFVDMFLLCFSFLFLERVCLQTLRRR